VSMPDKCIALADVHESTGTFMVVEGDTQQCAELSVPPSTPTLDRSTMEVPKNQGEQHDITSCDRPRDH
jgi:hypothetical protein